jgi:sucrose phosphorylase
MVYQFSLPPLLLDAVLNYDASVVSNWLDTLALPLASTTFFNFTASHDGIGVRPLEGLVSDARLERLVEWTKRQGGRVSTRRQPNGNDSPYELNVTYVDAMADPNGNQELHARRFLASQAVMLALPGIPGVYFHSLVGTSNDEAAVARTKQPRRINRRKFDRDELDTVLGQAGSLQERIWTGYRRLLSCRVVHAAFHPRASLQVEWKADSRLLAFRRTARDDSVELLVIWNVSPETWELRLPPSRVGSWKSDLISGLSVSEVIHVQPFQAYWIEGLAS